MHNAILERMPAGIPGDVTRKREATLEPGLVGTAPIPYGSPVNYDAAGKFAPVKAGDTGVTGFLCRPYPTQSGEDGKAPAGAQADILRRGYMSVRLASGAAAKNGQVYVRIVAVSGKQVGDIEAAADDTGSGDSVTHRTVPIALCAFTGPADAGGNVEIAYNL